MSVDEALLEADRRARIDALDVRRSFIVQAPAGSGKTELLIQRYLRLLAHVEHPEEVVAITFTVKAAQEMQLRAVAAMREAERGGTAPEGHHRRTLEAARQVLERDRERGWKLLESPRRMRIQTMDALNAGIARSLPFSSGLGAAGRIVTDDEMQLVYRDAAGATFDWLQTHGETNDAVERVLSHLDNNTGAYIDHVASMLATRDQWLAMTGAGLGQGGAGSKVRRQLERNIADQVTARLERVRRLLPDEHVFPPTDAACVGEWRDIAGRLLTKSGRWRKAVARSDGSARRDDVREEQMFELLRSLAGDPQLAAELHRVRQLPDPAYTDQQWAVLLALFRLLPTAVAELRRIFSERGLTDHTEVALAAAAALGRVDDPGEIGLLLDYTIRHLLIDEMQDTSLAQYRLIERLVAGWQPGDGRTLFCVGDPMQSIYRFRDAEVGRFLLARANGIGPVSLEPLVLRQNFRSGGRLVEWFNTVFGQILPAEDDIAAGAIAYSASVPIASERDSGVCRIYPLFDVAFDEEADFTLDVIRRCVDRQDDQSTAAVLVRSRTYLPLFLAKLRRAGIAHQAIEIDRLTDLPEVIDLLALTRALAHRGDRIAWLGLLRGPWVGLSWSDLHGLVRNDSSSTVWELLHDEARIAALSADAKGLVAAFRDTLAAVVAGHGVASLREKVERAWYLLRGPALLGNGDVDNVYRFLDALEAVDMAGTVGDVALLESRLDQERVSGRVSPGCRLHIMTMHRAKGLQFDHVVVYGLGRKARDDRKSILSWMNLPDTGNGPSTIVSPIGARAELDADPLHNFIEASERDKERLETDRLLYVACTRARSSVHLVGHVELTTDRAAFRDPPKGTLLHRLWPVVRDRFADAFQERAATPDADSVPPAKEARYRLPELRRLPPGFVLPQAPELPRSQELAENRILQDERQVDFYWVGSIARHAGTLLHRWLHSFSRGPLPASAADLDGLAASGRDRAKELGVPLRDLDAVTGRALLALRGILDDEKGRWILSGAGHAEMPVTGVWRGRVESIVIDRIRVDEHGVHWIIDYKASTHEGGDLEGFIAQEADRYRPQLAKYAHLYRNLLADPSIAVRTALYFPLLQQFREVDID